MPVGQRGALTRSSSVAAARPWQRLRWSVPLVLQLLLVALLATALAGPAWDTGRSSAQHLVVVVDTSASMAALDGDPDRLASARAAVLDEVDGLGSGARVSIIAAGAPASVVASELRPSEVRARLEALEVSEGPFDGDVASSLALSMDRPDRSTAFVLVTDGGLTGGEVSLLPPGTDARLVGRHPHRPLPGPRRVQRQVRRVVLVLVPPEHVRARERAGVQHRRLTEHVPTVGTLQESRPTQPHRRRRTVSRQRREVHQRDRRNNLQQERPIGIAGDREVASCRIAGHGEVGDFRR